MPNTKKATASTTRSRAGAPLAREPRGSRASGVHRESADSSENAPCDATTSLTESPAVDCPPETNSPTTPAPQESGGSPCTGSTSGPPSKRFRTFAVPPPSDELHLNGSDDHTSTKNRRLADKLTTDTAMGAKPAQSHQIATGPNPGTEASAINLNVPPPPNLADALVVKPPFNGNDARANLLSPQLNTLTLPIPVTHAPLSQFPSDVSSSTIPITSLTSASAVRSTSPLSSTSTVSTAPTLPALSAQPSCDIDEWSSLCGSPIAATGNMSLLTSIFSSPTLSNEDKGASSSTTNTTCGSQLSASSAGVSPLSTLSGDDSPPSSTQKADSCVPSPIYSPLMNAEDPASHLPPQTTSGQLQLPLSLATHQRPVSPTSEDSSPTTSRDGLSTPTHPTGTGLNLPSGNATHSSPSSWGSMNGLSVGRGLSSVATSSFHRSIGMLSPTTPPNVSTGTSSTETPRFAAWDRFLSSGISAGTPGFYGAAGGRTTPLGVGASHLSDVSPSSDLTQQYNTASRASLPHSYLRGPTQSGGANLLLGGLSDLIFFGELAANSGAGTPTSYTPSPWGSSVNRDPCTPSGAPTTKFHPSRPSATRPPQSTNSMWGSASSLDSSNYGYGSELGNTVTGQSQTANCDFQTSRAQAGVGLGGHNYTPGQPQADIAARGRARQRGGSPTATTYATRPSQPLARNHTTYLSGLRNDAYMAGNSFDSGREEVGSLASRSIKSESGDAGLFEGQANARHRAPYTSLPPRHDGVAFTGAGVKSYRQNELHGAGSPRNVSGRGVGTGTGRLGFTESEQRLMARYMKTSLVVEVKTRTGRFASLRRSPKTRDGRDSSGTSTGMRRSNSCSSDYRDAHDREMGARAPNDVDSIRDQVACGDLKLGSKSDGLPNEDSDVGHDSLGPARRYGPLSLLSSTMPHRTAPLGARPCSTHVQGGRDGIAPYASHRGRPFDRSF
eukprot:GHVN01052983.1.p1 GENE.GHVN01052983.1~~GHVN01052983.1.p1  ORF type:complete len:954 (-),score=148.77 GHVN01052983.1:568-3429(-)